MNCLFFVGIILASSAVSNSFTINSGSTEEKCGPNQIYDKCNSHCQRTCNNFDDDYIVCPPICIAGCMCIDGYVLDETTGNCVVSTECPKPLGKVSEECPINQEFDECNSQCQVTCDNWNTEITCPPVCIAGCRCIAGFVLDKEGICIPISECPAKLEECPINQEFDECTSQCPITCDNWDTEISCASVCVAGCRCIAGLVLDKEGNCIPMSECPAKLEECPINQEFDECTSQCPISCDNWDTEISCPSVCVAGCRCIAGLVLDKEGNCIPMSECPAILEECPINQEFDECTSQCPITCDNWDTEISCPSVCVAGCRCIAGLVLDKEGNCIPMSECPAKLEECPINQEFDECTSQCPITCDNWDTEISCPSVCVAGCRCIAGLVLDKEGNCIPMSECTAKLERN